VLSGVGGDELLCGYSSFRQIPQMAAFGRVAKAVPGLRAALRGPCAWLARCRRQAKLLGLPLYMDSLEGVYFLRRSLFLPAELPTLMGREAAAAGLSRLGGTPPGMDMAGASSAVAAVGLLESVHYLRNQLLRDSDWASMAHSLELRTPLVDAQLLAALAPHAAAFAGGVGKTMLARSPTRALPEVIMRLPKTGFGLPMADWLPASATREPWARQWARTVIARMPGCA
jgi:asparagine synthase (glutamine-hydrolysing)